MPTTSFSWMRHRFEIFALISLGMGCGSGDGLPRQPISGTVTLDGQPLATGSIAFRPADAAGPGVPVGAQIDGGSFSIARAVGPTPGTYHVAISSPQEGKATAKTTSAQPGDGDSPPAFDLIPPQYNAQTTLQAEVGAGKSNDFRFELKSR